MGLAQHVLNLPRLEKRLVRLVRESEGTCRQPSPRPDPPLPHRKRLTPDQVSDLVQRYQAGQPLRELASELGTSRPVVARFLRTAGVTLRPRGTQPGKAKAACPSSIPYGTTAWSRSPCCGERSACGRGQPL